MVNEGKNLRQVADSVSNDALEEAMLLAFGSESLADTMPEDESSKQVGRYKLLEKIGDGGFGVVYMAEQKEPIHRRVALKVIKLGMDTKQVIARFEAERQALAMMNHENIARVFDAGTTDTGRPYFVMELVQGITITDYCDRNKLSTQDRLRLFVAVCNAVQHAHQKGIIHRDLKPNNVMVTLRDGMAVPKVIDFGIAKATHTQLTEKTVFTRFGQFIGTPAYMSPEQIEMSELDIDTRSDIYSLGVLLYELLTGSTPIEKAQLKKASHSEIQKLISEEEPLKPSARLSRSGEALATLSAQRSTQPNKLQFILRGELDWIVMKALEKDRKRRYATSNELAKDVLRYLNNEPVEASPSSATYKLRKFARKHRKVLIGASGFGLLLVAATMISIWLSVRATQAEKDALYNKGLAEEGLKNERKLKNEMKNQRDVATKLGVELQNQLVETDRLAEQSRHLLYVAHTNLIQQKLRTGYDASILELLKFHRPVANKKDIRGFEWYYLWGLCQRNPWTWRHYASVESLAYSPDNKIVVTGCSDGSLQIWETTTGKILNSIKAHKSIVHDVKFSPNGQNLLSCSQDQTVKLWAITSDRLDLIKPIHKHLSPVYSVAFSPDGKKIASGGGRVNENGELHIWDRDSLKELIDHQQNQTIVSLSFSHDSANLAVGGISAKVDIWDVESNKIKNSIETRLQAISALTYSPIEKTIAMGDFQGTVELWDNKKGSRRLGKHAGQVTNLTFSQDGELVASCSSDSLIILWDAKKEEQFDILRGHVSKVNSVAFTADRTRIISSSVDNDIKTWDLTRGLATLNLASHANSVGPLLFSPTDSNTMVSGDKDGTVNLWNIKNSKVTTKLPRYNGQVRCIAFSPDGKQIAYAGGKSKFPSDIVLWDSVHRTMNRTKKAHSLPILTLAFSPDGKTLASGSDDGTIILWDAETREVKTRLSKQSEAIISLAFSPNGHWLATSSFNEKVITLWDLSDPRKHHELIGHKNRVTSVAFSPDSKMLASGSLDNTIRIWDIQKKQETHELKGHSQRVASVLFSPDQRSIASAGRDDKLKLWDVTTGQEKLSLDCQPEMEGVMLAFSSDGKKLATVNDRSILVYQATSELDYFYQDAPKIPSNKNSKTISATTLEASPFQHQHPDVTHATSHWQVRSDSDSYTTPVINIVSRKKLTSINVQNGILSPNEKYWWRVSYTGSNHKSTSFSEETSFTTNNFPMRVERFDLSKHFNRDIIKNPGDLFTDSIDSAIGAHLTVEGYDGKNSDNPRVHGLPVNRKVGVHTLGNYSHNNVIQTGLNDADIKPIRVSVKKEHFHFIKFLVVGGNGNSDMPVRFEYEDGTSQREIIHCDDWFHDIKENRFGLLRTGSLPILNEMDRFYQFKFRNENAAAIFEITMNLDPKKKLVALILELDSEDAQYIDTARYPRHNRTRFNLLSATGIKVGLQE